MPGGQHEGGGCQHEELSLPKIRARTEIFLAQTATAPARTTQSSKVAELARFFPEATPVRIPVQCTRIEHSTSGRERVAGAAQESGPQESTVIEFGTSREVLFACNMAVEFADVLRVRNCDGSLDTEVEVVAVQYHADHTILAARFLQQVPNWIVKS